MLRLITFGGLSLVDDGVPVTGAASQRSRLALLAILASAGAAGVSRDKLLASLWPESDEERARHALKQAVYALRRDIGNENAIAGTATLSLDPTIVTSDIREFEDALARSDDAAAVSVYGGPFLDGVFVRGAAEFDQWAGTERTRLERAYLDAIERLAKGAETTGDHAAAVQWWRKAAAAEPLSGRYALLLMRALAESGDVSTAIQHARVHDALVRAELESGADEKVLGFAEELKRGDWKPTPRVSKPVVVESPVVASVDSPAKVIVDAPPVAQPTMPTVQKKRSPLIVAGVLAAVAVLAWVGSALTRDEMPTIIGKAPAPASTKRFVIEGFANHTADRKLNLLGEYAADHIAQRLNNSNFEVVDRGATIAARSIFATTNLATAHDSALALAKETGASQVIAGKVYQAGDTLIFQADIVDRAKRLTVRSVSASGAASDSRAIVAKLANGIMAALAVSIDSTPGASTAGLIAPPSVEAFMHASHAWEMFFAKPADTTTVFEELRRALRSDSAYTTPRLMRAYILDVKERWADLAAEVKQLEPRREKLGRVENAALALYDADLRGNLADRLTASHELLRLSPGSVDMSLLVAVSASYLHRPKEVLYVLRKSNPELGINALTPMYWAWRAEAEHSLGDTASEMKSATELMRRFPNQLYGAQARARVLAAEGNTDSLHAHLQKLGYRSQTMTDDARKVAMLGARELRAHGHAAAADSIFAHVASIKTAPNASRDQREMHALALYETKNYAAAKAEYAQLVAADPKDVEAYGRLGAIAARTGDSATVRQVDAKLAGWSEPYSFGRSTYWRAHLAALSGRSGEAITLLHDAIGKGYRPMDLNIITIHEEPDFMPLWREAAFRQLLNRDGDPVLSP